MGWYGGQEGAARSRWHDQSRASYSRFLGTVKNAKLTSFYNKVAGEKHNTLASYVHAPPIRC